MARIRVLFLIEIFLDYQFSFRESTLYFYHKVGKVFRRGNQNSFKDWSRFQISSSKLVDCVISLAFESRERLS